MASGLARRSRTETANPAMSIANLTQKIEKTGVARWAGGLYSKAWLPTSVSEMDMYALLYYPTSVPSACLKSIEEAGDSALLDYGGADPVLEYQPHREHRDAAGLPDILSGGGSRGKLI